MANRGLLFLNLLFEFMHKTQVMKVDFLFFFSTPSRTISFLFSFFTTKMFKKIEPCRSCIVTLPYSLQPGEAAFKSTASRQAQAMPTAIKDGYLLCPHCVKFFGTQETLGLCSLCWAVSAPEDRVTPEIRTVRTKLVEQDNIRNDASRNHSLFNSYCEAMGLKYKIWSDIQFNVLTLQLHGRLPEEIEAALRGFREDMPATALTAEQGVDLHNHCLQAAPETIPEEKRCQYVHAIFPFVVNPWNIQRDRVQKYGGLVECYYIHDVPRRVVNLQKNWNLVFVGRSDQYHWSNYIYTICDCSICLDEVSNNEESVRCRTCSQSIHLRCALGVAGSTRKIKCPNCRTDWTHPNDIRLSPHVHVNYMRTVYLSLQGTAVIQEVVFGGE